MPEILPLLQVTSPTLMALATSVGLCTSAWLYSRNQHLKKAHCHLSSQNHRLENLISATNTGTWEWHIPSGEISVNEHWANLFGYCVAELGTINMAFWEKHTHPDDVKASNTLIQKCLHRQSERLRCEMRVRTKSGEWIWVLCQGQVVEWGPNEIPLRMAGTQVNITERKHTNQRDKHRSRVLQMLASETPLEELLDTIACDVSEADPHMLCSIRLLDTEGMTPFHTAAPYLPEFFVHTLDGFSSHASVRSGECADDQTVITQDIATDPLWKPYADIAHRAGLAACWTQPIVSTQGRVLGTFSVFHRTPRAPTAAHLQMLEDEARLTALAIEKTASSARQRLAASVFSHAREGITITDALGAIIDTNDTFTHITGYSRDETIGRNSRFLQSGMHKPEFFQSLWQELTHKGHWSGEIWNRRKSGETYPQMTTISAVRDHNGTVTNFVALFTDITSIKYHQQQLEHIAHYDALTGLPNRVLLADRLSQGIHQSQRHKRSLAVAYLDLDGFKAINDTHGHNMGDELLIVVSRRMKAVMREGDTLARIGGDEFIAVMVDLDTQRDTEIVLERLLGAASDPVTVGTTQLRVSASIGVTVYPQDDSDADVLMRHADQAMYVAKQAGKNRYHFFDVVQDAADQSQQDNLQLIRSALDKRQFLLHFQPKVNMRANTVVGVEALIRWQHPTRGLLPPESFLDTVENHPLGIEIGEWVIETALQQMQDWKGLGLELPVSVNIGAHQLQSPDFVAKIAAALKRHPNVPAANLELEILETSALRDIGAVSQVMKTCADLGVNFAIDDFGTGYSSLTYLKHLPASLLKIDQSFIRDMLNDSDDLAIVRGVIGLTEAFKRDVIAEGVETQEHCDMLLSMGCTLAQGYGIARPMASQDIPAWVQQWNDKGAEKRSRTRAKPKLVAIA